jgi:hypothetical protein
VSSRIRQILVDRIVAGRRIRIGFCGLGSLATSAVLTHDSVDLHASCDCVSIRECENFASERCQ